MTVEDSKYLVATIPTPGAEVMQAFDDLPLDPYCGGQHRFRRFSQYSLEWSDGRWHLNLLPHRPFLQSKEYNPFVGGVPRHLEPLQIDPLPQLAYAAEQFPLNHDQRWQVNVHQCRVVTSSEVRGVSVPEGPHRDGHQYGMVAVFRRDNIVGGESQLFHKGAAEPFFRHVLQASEAILYKDDQFLHTATDIEAVDEAKPAYRDLWIVAFNEWQARRYGPEFERKALAES